MQSNLNHPCQRAIWGEKNITSSPGEAISLHQTHSFSLILSLLPCLSVSISPFLSFSPSLSISFHFETQFVKGREWSSESSYLVCKGGWRPILSSQEFKLCAPVLWQAFNQALLPHTDSFSSPSLQSFCNGLRLTSERKYIIKKYDSSPRRTVWTPH